LLRDEIGENNATKKKGFKTNNNKKNEDQIWHNNKLKSNIEG
jgi:hypothetical protein